ncbi:T9SS type A sorting domain-containing protein [candidate division WOR-3 bacterium]|nr:T9SS type A sorting domain-containing protein [candidate division WOR-3 bacterium]
MNLRVVVTWFIVHIIFSFAQVSWEAHVIHNNTHGTSSVHACDLDNDGDIDVIGAVLEENQMVWWRNDGGNPITWTPFYIDAYLYRAWPLYVCDLDCDGDSDAVAASSWAGTNEVKWYENTGTGIAENHRLAASPDFGISIATIVSGPLPLPGDSEYRIYDISGQQVHSQNPTPGIYFIQGDGKITHRVIKVK